MKKSDFISVLLILIFPLSLVGFMSPQRAQPPSGLESNRLVSDPPTIDITHIPPYGWPLPHPVPNDSNDDPMRGQVNNVLPPDTYDNYYVTCYIELPDYPNITGETGWWVKPAYGLKKITDIADDGTWFCDVTTGGYDEYATKFRAYLFSTSLIEPPDYPPTECVLPTCIDYDEVIREIVPPETTIVNCPTNSTVSRDVSIEFKSDQTGDIFYCKLDNGVESLCTSPQSYTNLAIGQHNFSVAAENRVANRDLTPATCDWNIVNAPILVTFKSIGAHDGWILESSENSGVGGTKNSTSTQLYIGDDAANRQYRSILSFDTSTLPDNAIITSAMLKFKYAGKTGTLPFGTHGNLLVDVRKGAFSNNVALQLGDFKAPASKNKVLSFTSAKVNNWYSKLLSAANFSYINLLGVTQFRLRFTKDDNNDFGADFLKIYSGNAGAANRPQLVIEYYVP
jgi:hypothetical protein